jgi:enoyl-CoA hydratase
VGLQHTPPPPPPGDAERARPPPPAPPPPPIGLMTRVVPDEAFEAEVKKVARRLASGAPMPIRAIKEAVRAQHWDSPDRAAVLEERWAQKILASHDAHEGMSAFREKRKASFRGN